MMNVHKRIAGYTTVMALLLVVGIAQAQTTYTWTGADGAKNATWQNALNWAGGLVPNGVSGQLSTDTASDVVIFDSETATFMPSDSILTRNSWTGSFKNPQIQVLNGQVGTSWCISTTTR